MVKQLEFNNRGQITTSPEVKTDWEQRQLSQSMSENDPFSDLDKEGLWGRITEHLKGGKRKLAVGVLAVGTAAAATHLIGRAMDQNTSEHYKLSHPTTTNPPSGQTRP